MSIEARFFENGAKSWTPGHARRGLTAVSQTLLTSHLAQAFMKPVPNPLRSMRFQSTNSEIIPIVPSHVSTN